MHWHRSSKKRKKMLLGDEDDVDSTNKSVRIFFFWSFSCVHVLVHFVLIYFVYFYDFFFFIYFFFAADCATESLMSPLSAGAFHDTWISPSLAIPNLSSLPLSARFHSLSFSFTYFPLFPSLISSLPLSVSLSFSPSPCVPFSSPPPSFYHIYQPVVLLSSPALILEGAPDGDEASAADGYASPTRTGALLHRK